MTFERKKLGAVGEELATQFLISRGYRILARNLKTRYGEIDVLAADGQTAVIVEVKTKTNTLYGAPVEMVNRQKQRKLQTLAMDLANQHHLVDYRIDVVAIDLSQANQPAIEHYIAAI
jgi:putative endonuclease